MTKKEKIRETAFDVVIGLLMLHMCVCLMLLEGEVYGEPVTPTWHVINIIVGTVVAILVVRFVWQNLYRLWTDKDLLTGEPIENESNE